MEQIFLLFSLFYAGLILYFFIGIFRLPAVKNDNRLSVTVLVPARNEEKTIRRCLESLHRQTYPRELYRVWVIDDRSTDRTAKVVEDFIRDKPNFRLLRHHPSDANPTYKKQALQFAIRQVNSEVIMTIDADTVAQPRWMEKMIAQYLPDTGLVAGLVTFPREAEKSFFHKIQTLEFAGLVFCGVGSVGNGNPIICNGSNLSYRLRAFRDAGGYSGHLHLPSGDDDLLLQNIHKKTGWKVHYSIDPETINYTRPTDSLSEFLNQRARWASKSLHYPSRRVFFMMFSIYLFYLMIFLLAPLSLGGWFHWEIYLAGAGLKMVPEFFLIYKSLSILNRRDLLPWFPVAEVLQVPYIVYIGLRGFFKKFTWKDRTREQA